jgi:hypothetical protein
MHQLIHSRKLDDRHGESVPSQGAKIIHTYRLLAAAVMASATLAAQAQSTVPDGGFDTHWKFGVQAGSVHDNGKTEPVVQLTFGYEFNRTFSIEALADVNLLFERDGDNVDADSKYQFNTALGARALATLPLSDRWSLVGGLGVVQVNEELGLALHGYDRYKTETLVSAALMYRMNRHFGLGLEASTFTQSHTLNLGVRGEFHF